MGDRRLMAEGRSFRMRPPPPDAVVVWPAATIAVADVTGVQSADGQVTRLGALLETGGGCSDVRSTGRASGRPGTDVASVDDPAA